MTAWGKTGRVTLVGEVLPWVQVDGVAVGWLYTPDPDYSGWGPRTDEGYVDEHLPSRDEAVMWVLRRARPDVWRQERGEVWRVQVGTTEFPLARWHIHRPTANAHWEHYGCTPDHFDSTHSWELALADALRHAKRMSR